ncbi:MAG TPA: DUF4097 family beta strand repeat-containing protein [Ktedonobacterales bacterium]
MSEILKGLGNLIGRFGYGPELTDTTNQSFTVGGAPALNVHNTVGSIRVVTGDAGAIHVEAIRHARGITSDAQQADLDVITITCSQQGDTVRVDARMSQPGMALARQLWADLRITVPSNTSVEAKAEAGNVEITGSQGPVAARVDAGNLELSGTSGRVTANMGAGNLEASDVSLADGSRITVAAGQVVLRGSLAPGASVEIRVEAGRARLTLPRTTATHLEATADVGAVSINGWPISVARNVVAARAFGDLGAGQLGRLTVRVSIGDITLSAAG